VRLELVDERSEDYKLLSLQGLELVDERSELESLILWAWLEPKNRTFGI
jgi:hypothetical protein